MPKLSSVLLVDDDPTTNYLNERLLLTLGVTEQCLVATNGAEALDLLAEVCTPSGPACPKLILLDVNMPIMNGVEFLAAYQQQVPVPHFIIILLTTSQHLRDLDELQKRSAVAGVLHKPLTKEKLYAVLHEHFYWEPPLA